MRRRGTYKKDNSKRVLCDREIHAHATTHIYVRARTHTHTQTHTHTNTHTHTHTNTHKYTHAYVLTMSLPAHVHINSLVLPYFVSVCVSAILFFALFVLHQCQEAAPAALAAAA
jgi:carbohydrate-binding DOMON domain-containing protein